MNTRTLLALAVVLGLMGLVTTTTYSDSHTEAKPPAPESKPAEPPKPANPAALMKQLLGDWSAAGEWFMPGSTVGNPFPGDAKFSMVMNSYVQQDFTANLGGMTFQGRGMIAYDMTKNKWQNTWADSMSTNIVYTEPTWDEKTQSWISKYEATIPNLGSYNMRDTFTIDSNDQLTLSSYRTAKTEGAKEELGMKIVYKRKAKAEDK